MTDRPILFSAPMVRALLDGRKTQTRRLLRNPEYYGCPTGDCPHNTQAECNVAMQENALPDVLYAPGDRLWVKETWRTWKDCDRIKPVDLPQFGAPVFFEADRDNCDRHGKARVSIHMPRWASRLTLTVTDVRVQRLHQISDDDALAEGIYFDRIGYTAGHMGGIGGCNQEWSASPEIAFRNLWRLINGPEAWDANPWVVALTFDVEHRNIDQ